MQCSGYYVGNSMIRRVLTYTFIKYKVHWMIQQESVRSACQSVCFLLKLHARSACRGSVGNCLIGYTLQRRDSETVAWATCTKQGFNINVAARAHTHADHTGEKEGKQMGTYWARTLVSATTARSRRASARTSCRDTPNALLEDRQPVGKRAALVGPVRRRSSSLVLLSPRSLCCWLIPPMMARRLLSGRSVGNCAPAQR